MTISAEQLNPIGHSQRLRLVEDLWARFAAEATGEKEPAILEELERRSAWCQANPGQGKTMAQLSQALGIKV